jgi:SAM-dependent methyltransferase
MTIPARHAQCGYVLGYSDAERDRLIRQAGVLAPVTERLLSEAGITEGQRVLDLGCGAGDVSIILARLVGDAGEVIGIEQNPSMIALARKRSAASGLLNVTFLERDAQAMAFERRFDAVVGRLVLNHVRDPAAVLRSVASAVRPGGAVVIQEGAWGPTLAIAARLPLWSQLLSIICQTLVRSGHNPDRGLDLNRLFEEAGLSRPTMSLDIPLAGDDSIAELQLDLFRTLRPAALDHSVPLAGLGDLNTLARRIHAERTDAHAVVGFLAIVSAWCRLAA